jgi:ADP-ribose pyrophosphatase
MTNSPIVPREIQKVFQGRIFSVQIETLTLPKGGEMKAEIVRHPGSAVIIPVTDSGDIILVRQYRPAIGRWAWELPAGTLKPGEDPEQGAIRECQEEIGLIPARAEKVGALFPTPGYCDEEMNYFRVTGLREPGEHDEAAVPDDDEDLEPRAFSVSEIRAMVKRGEIIDLKTVGALVLLE